MAGSVWYIGYSDDRVIDSSEWTRIGRPGVTSRWYFGNGWSVDQAVLTSQQITFLNSLDEFLVTATVGPRPGAAQVAQPNAPVSEGRVVEIVSQWPPDLPEYSLAPRTSAISPPTNLQGKIARFDTSAAAIVQPLPPAETGAIFTVWWESGSVANPLTYTGATRVDTCGTTNGSPVVTDTTIAAADAGRVVSGTGIPTGCVVGAVIAGTSFRLSSSVTAQVDVNATATAGSVSLTLQDAVGSGVSGSGGPAMPGEGITLHCTTPGRWRAVSIDRTTAALDARYPKTDQSGAAVGSVPTADVASPPHFKTVTGELAAELYGAVGDARSVTDAAITSSAAALTSATAAFTSADVGKTVMVTGAGASGALLTTTVAAYVSATQLTLAATAGTTVSGAVCFLGTDDTTALQAAINAARTLKRGTVVLTQSAYLTTAQLDIRAVAAPPGDDWSDRGALLRGRGVGVTRILAGHNGTAIRFYSGKMFSGLRDLELVGPGKTVAGSRGLYWDGTDGSAHFSDVYFHGFETGALWRDATLHTLLNFSIRRCGTGLITGYNYDIHTWVGGRIEYCDTAVQVGYNDGTNAERDNFSNPIHFIGTRLSNNGTRAVFVSDRYANVHFDGCYFESNPREADIGVNGRNDGVGPIVTFTDCFFTPVTTNPVAIGIDVWNAARITVERCATDGDSRYTIFCRMNLENGAAFESKHSRIRGATASVQYAGRNFLDTSEKREGVRLGLYDHEQVQGAYLPASNVWHEHSMPGGTGKTWDRWTRRSSADNSILSELSLYDTGGVLRLGGTGSAPGYICATSISALPTASVNYRGSLAYVPGDGTTTADTFYICLMSSSGTYSWKSIVAG